VTTLHATEMVQIFLHFRGGIRTVEVDNEQENIIVIQALRQSVSSEFGIGQNSLFTLFNEGGTQAVGECNVKALTSNGCSFHVRLPVVGGIDFQHREGSKIGSGGQLSESQAAIERKERLRKLALETIDISKDPYFMRNHLGSYECKLCLTLHPNEGNYLAHTQGKRHQSNLGRRAAMEAKAAAPRVTTKEVTKRRVIKIGRPGYKVIKRLECGYNNANTSMQFFFAFFLFLLVGFFCSVDFPFDRRNPHPSRLFLPLTYAVLSLNVAWCT
jgi:Zinc-finger of C2H2 type